MCVSPRLLGGGSSVYDDLHRFSKWGAEPRLKSIRQLKERSRMYFKRQLPHPSELRELMQFKKPELNPVKRRLEKALTIDDLRAIAKRRTQKSPFEYTDAAALDEISIVRSRQAFEDIVFHPDILRGTSEIDTTVNILGGPSTLPFGIALTGF